MAEGGSQRDARRNKAFKAMNRPLTVLGAERRLFFVALIAGGAVFSLMHSLVGGIGLFIVRHHCPHRHEARRRNPPCAL